MLKKVKKSVGLEINDNNIKVLEVIEKDGGKTISAFGEVKLALGIVDKGVILDADALSKKLKEVFLTATPNAINCEEIYFALPDELVYTHVFRVGKLYEKELDKIITSECNKNIPLLFRELEISYRTIEEHKKSNEIKVVLAATFKKSLTKWQNFFESENLKIRFFDIEAFAQYRGMYESFVNGAMGVLCIKEKYHKFSLFSVSGLEYEYTSYSGLGKISVGNEKDLQSETSSMENLLKEIRENLNYELNKLKSLNNELIKGNTKLLKEIVVCGDSKNLSDFVSGLNKSGSDYSFKLGNSSLSSGSIDIKYFQALGVIAKSWDSTWEESDPVFYRPQSVSDLKNKINNRAKNFLGAVIAKKRMPVIVALVIILVMGAVYLYFHLIYENTRERGVSENVPESSIVSDGTIVQNQDPDMTQGINQTATGTAPIAQMEEKNIKKYVKVNRLSGALNVRTGPGEQFESFDKLMSETEHVLLEEKGDWYKIELPNAKSAWISAKYSSKK